MQPGGKRLADTGNAPLRHSVPPPPQRGEELVCYKANPVARQGKIPFGPFGPFSPCRLFSLSFSHSFFSLWAFNLNRQNDIFIIFAG